MFAKTEPSPASVGDSIEITLLIVSLLRTPEPLAVQVRLAETPTPLPPIESGSEWQSMRLTKSVASHDGGYESIYSAVMQVEQGKTGLQFKYDKIFDTPLAAVALGWDVTEPMPELTVEEMETWRQIILDPPELEPDTFEMPD